MNDERRKFQPDYQRHTQSLHPVHIEFVAIPKYFDIRSYLSIREIAGQFMSHDITLESVLLIAEAVKEGPVFTLSSPTGTYAASALFVIEILKQLKLTMKAFSNFIPIDIKSYESILRNTTFKNEKGNAVIDMTIIFINAYKMVEEGVLESVVKSITQVEEYEAEMVETAKMYKS